MLRAMLRIGKYRTLGLAGLVAVVAMLVVASVGAASASAACPVVGGKEQPCYVPKKGVFPVKFTSAGGEKFLYSTESGAKATIKCTSNTDTGELTGPRSDTDTVTFTGCEEVEPFKGKCTTKGQAEGTIKTQTLSSKPVYLGKGEKASEGVGIDLTGAGTGELEAEFECPGLFGNITIKVTKSVIGKVVSKLNEMSKTAELSFKCKAVGSTEQEPKSYWEGGVEVKDFLLSNGSEACEEEKANDTITFTNEEVELKA